jgi:hypothetical protein
MKNAEDLPRNYVLAVVDGRDAAATTVIELRRAGFAETLELHGTELQEAAGSNDNKTGNFLMRALKSIPEHLSEEPEYLAQYQEEAEKGRSVIAVKAGDRDQADVIGEILQRCGALNARFFGALMVTDLSGQRNPSAQEVTASSPPTA